MIFSTAGGEQIKPRIFTTKRRGKTFLFIDIAKFNPKKFGAFGSKQWFMSLVKHLDEPGVVRLENVKSWFQQFYDTFAVRVSKHKAKLIILDKKNLGIHDKFASLTTSAKNLVCQKH